MKICLVHEEYPSETNFGGIATYQKLLAEELVRQGNKVYVIARGLDKDKFYIENGVNIYRVYQEKSNDQIYDYEKYRRKVAKILEELQKNKEIEIVEVPDWGAETVMFEKKRQIPLIVRMHTPLKVWLKYNKNDFGKVTDKMLEWEEKMIYNANYITCCSQALKKILLDEFKVKDNEIHVTPNPANITNFYRDNNIIRENKIIFVGSLEERKGVIVLAKALNIVFEKYNNLKIEFIGKNTNRNYKNISTINLVKELVNEKYHSNLIFTGQIENEEVNEHLNSSRVAVFPSLFDNFPYVVLEAMSTGINIVGSKNSGMVEMLNDNDAIYDTGNYEDLAKKIILEYEKSFIEEINQKNIERVKKEYNSSKIVKELLVIYKSVLDEYNKENK